MLAWLLVPSLNLRCFIRRPTLLLLDEFCFVVEVIRHPFGGVAFGLFSCGLRVMLFIACPSFLDAG